MRPKDKLKDVPELLAILEDERAAGKRIVFKSGVWDLFSVGHAASIAAARRAGDLLAIGVHGDQMTKARKGPDRPVRTETKRALLLAHLHEIAYVAIVQDQEELYAIIDTLSGSDTLCVSETSTQGTENHPDTMRERYGRRTNVVVMTEQDGTHNTDEIARIRNGPAPLPPQSSL